MGFLEGPLWVPHFVLKELQHFADSQDPLRRAKGRRGLETLERLREAAPSEVLETTPKGESVDEKLLFLARDLGPPWSPTTTPSCRWPGSTG